MTDPNGGVTEYTYNAAHEMVTIKDTRGIVYLTNEYTNGRVTKQTQADGTTYQFAYTLDGNGKITQTDVTDAGGYVRRATFNSSGYILIDTRALGRPEQQVTTFERQAGTNLISSATDPVGRRTTYVYDTFGNITSITPAAGTPDAVTTSLTYESNFNQVANIIDPLGHTTSFAYDNQGNVTSISDPLNHQVTFAYNASGRPISVTNASGNSIQFSYDLGDLASVTNPLGRVTTFFTDGIGRVLSITDPVGATNLYEYNVLNLLTRKTDRRGGQVTFAYDPNGNLLSVTDPQGGITQYTFDNMDRIVSRTDPLLLTETYQYDAGGNLTKLTDRRGKVISFSYDGLKRRTFAGFGQVVIGGSTTYESTASFTYDLANRLTQAVDSLVGTATFTFDNLDRMSSKTNPQGTVSYSYDAAGRRTSMTVAGQSAVSFSYDNANRLTGITQGTSGVSMSYDVSNRRAALTLPNGIVMRYSYDGASELTGITYSLDPTVLGDLRYEYDNSGNPTRLSGSYARTGLPQAVVSATYNAGNRLTQWGTTNLTYDANGNLLNDGTNTYGWDARNQLGSLTAPGISASFLYDTFGNRVSKTVNGSTTAFLYDGANAVQEISGGAPTANLLVGLGGDEYLTRTDSAGTRNFLTDAVGNTIALADSTGTLQTQYTYEPFGTTTTTGSANTNPFQFTGRETDGTSLFYYRARYYSPALQRFVSEDPVGFRGGDINLYAYVANSPVLNSDASGLGDDPGGPGIRYCIQTFIPTPVTSFLFKGDNRGPQPCCGTFRTDQDIYQPDGVTIESVDTGITIPLIGLDSLGLKGVQGPSSLGIKPLPSGGRKITVSNSASLGYGGRMAPPIAYDITIVEEPNGYAHVVDVNAKTYPALEVWQYGGPSGPVLVYYYDPSCSGANPVTSLPGGKKPLPH